MCQRSKSADAGAAQGHQRMVKGQKAKNVMLAAPHEQL